MPPRSGWIAPFPITPSFDPTIRSFKDDTVLRTFLWSYVWPWIRPLCFDVLTAPSFASGTQDMLWVGDDVTISLPNSCALSALLQLLSIVRTAGWGTAATIFAAYAASVLVAPLLFG